jgi:hypothetical protein
MSENRPRRGKAYRSNDYRTPAPNEIAVLQLRLDWSDPEWNALRRRIEEERD